MEPDFDSQGPASSPAEEGSDSAPRFVAAISPSMSVVEAVIGELAHSSVPVLLIGERGTGKKTIALRIHQSPGWRGEQFRVLKCRELSSDVLKPDMLPSGATLYLEEIGDLNPRCQGELLELLSKHNGWGSRDLRLICGSSRDLEPELKEGKFREDLYYRLSGVCLRIPPLRQRKEDVPRLMTFFLERYAELFQRPVPALSAATQQLFVQHSWPGNLAELEAAARAIVAVGDESVAMGGLRAVLTRNHGNGEKTSLKEAARAASREAERELILKVLARTRWNRRRAAQELQISYKALLYKLKQIGYGEFGAS